MPPPGPDAAVDNTAAKADTPDAVVKAPAMTNDVRPKQTRPQSSRPALHDPAAAAAAAAASKAAANVDGAALARQRLARKAQFGAAVVGGGGGRAVAPTAAARAANEVRLRRTFPSARWRCSWVESRVLRTSVRANQPSLSRSHPRTSTLALSTHSCSYRHSHTHSLPLSPSGGAGEQRREGPSPGYSGGCGGGA
jgi:hypothetical protein